jgi:PAS domain S-box-containing protein
MQNAQQTSFSSRLNRAFVLPVALLALLAGVLLLETQSLTKSMQWVDHTDQVISQSRRLMRHIVEMETSLRGYQLTGAEDFLRPFENADSLVDSDFRDLERFSHNPVQQQRVELMRTDFTEWRKYAVQTIARRRNGESTSSYAENMEGKRLMDRIRQVREQFVAEAEQTREERVRKAQEVSNLVFGSSVLLTFVIGGLVIFLTRRQMSSLTRSYQETAAAAERRAAELERLSAIVESSEDGIIGKTLEGTITSWNRGAEQLYGYAETEVLGRSIDILVPADHANELPEILQRLARGERIERYESVRRKKDGTLVDVATTISPILDVAGNIVGASSIARDITQRKRAEEALRQSEQRLALSLKASHSGTFDWDAKSHKRFWSDDMLALYGMKREEFGGRFEDWLACVVPEDQEAAAAAVNRSLETGELAGEYRIRRRDNGEVRWINSRGQAFFDETGKAVRIVGINVDITERKQAELALRESERELRRLSGALITAEEDAARQIARELHDDITQRLALLSMEIGKTAARPPVAGELVSQLRSYQAKILDVSEGIRKISHQMHPSILDDLGLSAALESMCLELQRVEGTSVHFEAREVPDHLDRTLASCLYRVCQESLRNVSKHAQADDVNVVLSRAGEFLHLEVFDSGVGFESSGQKPGLGTYSIKERIRVVNGTVSIESEPGQGTRVIARVPLNGGAREAKAHSAAN